MKYLVLIQTTDGNWLTAEQHDELVAAAARFLLIRENNPLANVVLVAVLA